MIKASLKDTLHFLDRGKQSLNKILQADLIIRSLDKFCNNKEDIFYN